MTWLIVLLVAGAVAAAGTLLHTFAVGLDIWGADLLFNRVGCLTISSYAAIAARRGSPAASYLIGFFFWSWPSLRSWASLDAWKSHLLMHGEGALEEDLKRSCDSLNVLLAGDAHALVLIAALRQHIPNP